MIVLIDNGHGRETPGKRSPDGRLLEWDYNRQVARRIRQALVEQGVDARLLVPEDADVALRQRVARANAVTGDRVMLVSVHVNAAGRGEWMGAQGWGAYVAPNASAASRRLAGMLADEARALGLRVRQPLPGQPYWVQSLAMCRDTRCPAVLTENLFMDNRADLAYLLTADGLQTIVDVHVRAILRYCNEY